MKFPKPYTLSQIAKIINVSYVGDASFPVLGMNEIHVVESGDIVFGDEEIIDISPLEEFTLREYDRRIVTTFLNKYNNDVKLVAKKLDIGAATIYRMLKEQEATGGKESF